MIGRKICTNLKVYLINASHDFHRALWARKGFYDIMSAAPPLHVPLPWRFSPPESLFLPISHTSTPIGRQSATPRRRCPPAFDGAPKRVLNAHIKIFGQRTLCDAKLQGVVDELPPHLLVTAHQRNDALVLFYTLFCYFELIVPSRLRVTFISLIGI